MFKDKVIQSESLLNEFYENRDLYESASEFAKRVGVTKQTVINYHKKGVFQGVVVNGDYYFEKDRMYEFIKVNNSITRRKMEEARRFIFICNTNEEVSKYQEQLVKYMESHGVVCEDDLEEVIEGALNSDYTEDDILVPLSIIDDKAKAEKELEISKASQEIKAQYEALTNYLKEPECFVDMALLIKHIMSGDIDEKIDGKEQRMTFEEVSEYLNSNGKSGYTPKLVQFMSAYIGAFLRSTYEYDCIERLNKIKDAIEKKYSRDGAEYKRIYDEYVSATKEKTLLSKRLSKRLKKGIYSMDYILLGGNDTDIVDKIYELSKNYKDVYIYGSEYLSEDNKKVLSYFEKDGSKFTLWESSAFSMNYAQ